MGISGLDDVLDPGFLDGIATLPLDELRRRRRRATELEAGLSYFRRLVQGRLDVLVDESRRRDAGGRPGDLSTLVQRLPEILGERVQGPGRGRLPTFVAPADAGGERVEPLDLIIDAEQLATLPDLDEGDFRSRLIALAALEQEVSADRLAVHRVIDRLDEEVVRRYKTGEATVEGLLL